MIGEVGPLHLSLRAKIVGPFVLIVALIGTIGTAAVTALVTNESIAEFNGSLLRASLLANDHLSLVEAARLTTLRAAAATTGVPEATTSHDTAALQRLLTPVVANAAVPSLLLHVLDRQGREVIAVGPDGPAAVSSSSGEFIAEPAVAAVLAGRSDAQGDKYVFLRTDPSGTTLYWTGPIRGVTGQVIGVALVGQPLSAIAGGIRSSSADQLSFYGPSGEIGYLGKVFNLMTIGLQEKTQALEDTYFAAIEALARAIDARDPYTYGHSARVAAFSLEIADELGFPQDKREGLRRSALLHDIGKIGIEDHILRKAGALNYLEAKQMREHPVIGHQMLKDVPFLHSSLSGIRHHHERWDGTGYPDTLGGEMIPLQVRILSVSDVFDALTSDRPYRQAMSVAEASELIEREAGRQFDPAVVAAFKARREALVAILKQQRASNSPLPLGERPGNFPLALVGQGNFPPPLAAQGRV